MESREEMIRELLAGMAEIETFHDEPHDVARQFMSWVSAVETALAAAGMDVEHGTWKAASENIRFTEDSSAFVMHMKAMKAVLLGIYHRIGGSEASSELLDPLLIDGTKTYLQKVVAQANGCYERGWYDASAVMLRKMIETLITRDPLVGRDVLVGLVAAVGLTALLIARTHALGIEALQVLMAPVLLGLQSPRATMAMIASVVQEGFLYGVGLLFSLVMIRQVVRKTWIAVALLMIAGSVLTPGAVSGVADLPFIVLFGLVVLLTTIRFGLLAAIVMQICERLLTRSPLTLHTDSWYFGLSLVILMLVAVVAIYGFIVSLAGRPAFGSHVAAAAN